MKKKDIIKEFLDNLYEQGTGSHDTFKGIKVKNHSFWTGEFFINNSVYGYDEAINYLRSL
jgi:hypothetical protein